MLTHLLDPPPSLSSRPAGDTRAASSPSAKRKAEEQPPAAAEPSSSAVVQHYYHPQVRRTGSGEILSRGDGCGPRGAAIHAGEGPVKRLKMLERRLEGSEVGTDATDGGKTISLPVADFSLNPPAGQYTPCSEAGGGGSGAAGGVSGNALQQHSNAVSETNSHFATSEVAKLALTISQSSHWLHDNDIFSGPFRPPPPAPPPTTSGAGITTATTCSSTNILNNNRSLEPTSATSAAIFGSPVATDRYQNNASAFNTPNRRSSASAAVNDDGGAGAAAAGSAGVKALAGAAAAIAKAAEPPVLDAWAVGGGVVGAGGTPAALNNNAQDDTAHGTRKKRKSPHFTEAEDEMILKGYEKFGDNWQAIIAWGNFDPEVRTAASVRGRFSRLPAARKKGVVVVPPDPDVHPQQLPQAPAKPILSNHSTCSLEGQQQPQQQQPHVGAQHETPARQQQRGWKGEGATLPHLLWSPNVDAPGGGGGGGNSNNGESAMTSATCSPSGKAASTKKIHEYFQRSGGGGGTGKRPRPPPAGDDDAMQHISLHDEAPTVAEDDLVYMILHKPSSAAPSRREAVLAQRLNDELEQTRAQLAHAFESNETLRSERDAFAKAHEDLLAQVSSLESESDALRRDAQQNIKTIESRAVAELAKARARIVDVLREKARHEAREVRQKAAKESLRLGGLKYDRHGIGFHERWESGYLAKEQEEAMEALVREREEIERKRKLLSKRLKQSKAAADAAAPDFSAKPDSSNPPPPSSTTVASTSTAAAAAAAAAATAAPTIDRITQAEYFEHSEIYSLRLAALKREELELRVRQAETHRERTAHIREMRRIAEEDRSRFSPHPLLNDRYLLMSLIGKGGFSEVYKAFDLVELRTVACKIHSLNDQWGEERKEFYIKHSLREYRIQKILDHPRVVKLFDVFEYDHLSFCTVMEYVCEGKDLESHLGMVKTVPEREARSIITQVVAALRYLNELDQPIIHYDLKPGKAEGNEGVTGRALLVSQHII
ncbi:hypothetical protein HDU87_004204 [Geranomyces variabilis]|uniref:Protein kinase domain-containing protein n=1 Tax=Geranomyces variabilis TaxID=109894 RepID=A0AAD5TIW8_9FUNG|nr:hypothetical protein HDU87_004204 [Geranomyces variabilis]